MNELQEKMDYVYVYLDPRKPGEYVYNDYKFEYEPFYVGRGCNGRAYAHLKEKQDSELYKYIQEIINDTDTIPIIKYYKRGLTTLEACNEENKLIQSIGKLNNNKGPLFNKINGCKTYNKNYGNYYNYNLSYNEMMKNLKKKDKDIIRMKQEGYTCREIGKKLKCSKAKVSKLYIYYISILKQSLQ